jgi:hypothetical protein
MRGGQVTLFVAVGLVVLLVLGFLLLVTQRARSVEIADANKYPLLASLVPQCLDTIMADELTTLGLTGGLSVLNASLFPQSAFPWGETNVTLGGEQHTVRVLYGVTANTPPSALCVTNDTLGVNLYRCQGNPACTPLPWLAFQDGYFGTTRFSAICSRQGPNGPGSSVPCRYYPGAPPGTPTGTGGQTVQDELTRRVQERLTHCIDTTQASDAIGQRVSAIAPPVIDIKLTRENVAVHVEYTLLVEGRVQRITLPFTRNYRVRLLSVMEYAIDIARALTRGTVNVQREHANATLFPSYRQGFVVAVRRGVIPTDRAPSVDTVAHLVMIQDSGSRIGTLPYLYAFLVERRVLMAQLGGACTPLASVHPRRVGADACRNGMQDAGETGVDCGGTCGACVPNPCVAVSVYSPDLARTLIPSAIDAYCILIDQDGYLWNWSAPPPPSETT